MNYKPCEGNCEKTKGFSFKLINGKLVCKHCPELYLEEEAAELVTFDANERLNTIKFYKRHDPDYATALSEKINEIRKKSR